MSFFFNFAIVAIGIITLFAIILLVYVFRQSFEVVSRSTGKKVEDYKKGVSEKHGSFENVFNYLSSVCLTFNFSQWLLSMDTSFNFFTEKKTMAAIDAKNEELLGDPAAVASVSVKGSNLSPINYLKNASGKVLFNCLDREVIAEMAQGKVDVKLNGLEIGVIDFQNNKIIPSGGEKEWKILPADVPLSFREVYRPQFSKKALDLRLAFQAWVDSYKFLKNEKTFAAIQYFPWNALLEKEARFLFSDSSKIDSLSEKEKALLVVAALIGKSMFIAQAAASRKKQF